jgi:hypothetical protein
VVLTIVSFDSGMWVQYVRHPSGVMSLAPVLSGLDFEQDLPASWDEYVANSLVSCSVASDGYITTR